MKYLFQDGNILELHYKQKGASLFDCYDNASLKKLSCMIGLEVVAAYDSEYPDTPKGKRQLKVACKAYSPWEFAVMDGKCYMFTTVTVIEDEEKPKEIRPKVVQIPTQPAEAENDFAEINFAQILDDE